MADGVVPLSDSAGETLRGAFRQSRDAAVRHPAIVTLAEAVDFNEEKLAAILDESEPMLLAAVADQAADVESLYVSRTMLRRRAQAQAGQRKTLGGAEHEKTARRATTKLDASPEWQRVEESIRAALDRLRASLEQVMVPQLRQRLNEEKQQRAALDELYARPLDDVDTSSLRNEEDSFVCTDRLADLGRLIARMPGGSIGIAGSRGSGKSTAIVNVERLLPTQSDGDAYRVFDVTVAAPVTYVPLDFLMHLHDEICRGWLEHEGFDSTRPAQASKHRRTVPGSLLLPVVVLLASVALVSVVRYVQEGPVDTTPRVAPLVAMLAVVALSAWLGETMLRRVLASRLDEAEERGGVEGVRRKEEYSGAERWQTPRRRSRLFVLVLSVWSILAGTSLVLHAALPGFGDRALAASLLLVVGFLAVPLWRAIQRDRLDEQRISQVVLGTPALAAFLAAGVSGAGLLLPADVFTTTVDLVVGCATAAAAACLLPLSGAGNDTTPVVSTSGLTAVGMAWEDRRRMDFQRTQSQGQAVTLKVGASRFLPLGLDSQHSASVSNAEVPLSVPTVTRMIRDLLTQISRENPEDTFKVVVGIDELDKIDEADSARTFLNEIKGIFRVPGTIFLVSMSEDAMAGFERRDLSFRSVFDSAFDEVVYLPQFLLPETRSVVDRRINDVPRTFVDLAHCLSAGLARDVIRSVDHMNDAPAPQSLARVTQFVVHRQLRGKWQAIVAALRGVPLDPQVTDVIKALYRIDRCPDTEDWSGRLADYEDDDRCMLREDPFEAVYLLDLAPPGESELPQFRMLQRLGGEYLCFTYFCRTVMQFFDGADSDPNQRLIMAENADRLRHPSLDYLARGRYHLAVNPRLGWEQVSNFSQAHSLGPPMLFPDALLGHRPVTPAVEVVEPVDVAG